MMPGILYSPMLLASPTANSRMASISPAVSLKEHTEIRRETLLLVVSDLDHRAFGDGRVPVDL